MNIALFFYVILAHHFISKAMHMSALIINANKMADLKLFVDLAKRLCISSKMLTQEEKEEIGLYKAMLEGRKTKLVSRTSVMKKLES